jgi:hypothetical protein
MYNTLDQDNDHRRTLLAAARAGQTAAQRELLREFGVRVYTPKERKAMTYDTSTLPCSRRREILPGGR